MCTQCNHLPFCLLKQSLTFFMSYVISGIKINKSRLSVFVSFLTRCVRSSTWTSKMTIHWCHYKLYLFQNQWDISHIFKTEKTWKHSMDFWSWGIIWEMIANILFVFQRAAMTKYKRQRDLTTILEQRSTRPRYLQDWFFLRLFFFAGRGPSSPHVLTWCSLCVCLWPNLHTL